MNTFMQSTPNTMTPPVLPQSKRPGSERSTPVTAAPTPNYFGNARARGPVGEAGVNRGMASELPMNLSGAMSGMSLNGGGNMGMGQFHPVHRTSTATTTRDYFCASASFFV